MKRTGPTNPQVQTLVAELRRISSVEKTPLWSLVAEDLEAARRNKCVVNLSSINRVAKENETVLVPGKVLGSGILNSKMTIAALGFSKSAHDRITQAHGKCLTISDLLKENPKGSNVKVLG